MRKIILLLSVVTLVFVGCSSLPKNPYSVNEFISLGTDNVLHLRGISDSFKEKEYEKAVTNSHQKALKQLFYLGYPGTSFKNPVITQGESVELKHKDFFDNFWKEGYKRYILETNSQKFGCADQKKCLTVSTEFKVNFNQLRKELERNKIVNKVGF